MKRSFLLQFFLMVSVFLQAQWQPTNGPSGGNISCMLVKGQYIFAGTSDHGLYFSSDNGNTWLLKKKAI